MAYCLMEHKILFTKCLDWMENLKERKYILDIIFSEFLECKYYHEIGSSNYQIILENSNKIIIEDHFFNKYRKNLS